MLENVPRCQPSEKREKMGDDARHRAPSPHRSPLHIVALTSAPPPPIDWWTESTSRAFYVRRADIQRVEEEEADMASVQASQPAIGRLVCVAQAANVRVVAQDGNPRPQETQDSESPVVIGQRVLRESAV